MIWLEKFKERLVKAAGVWPDVCSSVEYIALRLAILVIFLVGLVYMGWVLIKPHVM
jgi:hypothetical protein